MFNPKLITSTKLQLAVILILTILAYLNIFQNQFVIDDKTFIVNWEEKNSLLNIPKFFAGQVPEGHEGVYRPLRSVIYAIDYQLFNINPFGYHLQALLVHLTITILIYFISLQIFSLHKSSIINQTRPSSGGKSLAFITALLFGLHPIHTETITYMASSVDTIGIAFMLASLYLYLKSQISPIGQIRQSRLISSAVLAITAYFTFEVTLVLPLLMILYDLCFKFKSFRNLLSLKSFKIYLPYLAGAIIYLFIRFFLLHTGNRGPYLADSIFLTALTMTKVLLKYISLTLFPFNLANNHLISKGIEAFVYRDYREEAIRAQTIFDLDIIVSIAVIASLLTAAIRLYKKLPILTFGIGWFFISLLPVSEIIPQGSMLNERFLYLPSFGFVLVLVGLLYCYIVPLLIKINNNLTIEQSNNFLSLFLISLSLVFGVLTFQRNQDWHDSISLWSKDIKIYPNDNAYAYFQLGNAYFEKAQGDLAIQNYQKSYQINPHFGVSLASIARSYENLGQLDKAIDTYKQTIQKNPSIWEAHLKLADIYTKRADFDLAANEYDYLIKNYPQLKEFVTLKSQLPEIREATNSMGIKDDGVWLRYHATGGLTISYPSSWNLNDAGSRLSFRSDSESFIVDLRIENKDPGISNELYFKNQTESFGELKNQGPALIPNFDSAYVKVFDDSGNQKMLFYLFKGSKVLKVLAYPANSDQMRTLDTIMGSIKLN